MSLLSIDVNNKGIFFIRVIRGLIILIHRIYTMYETHVVTYAVSKWFIIVI